MEQWVEEQATTALLRSDENLKEALVWLREWDVSHQSRGDAAEEEADQRPIEEELDGIVQQFEAPEPLSEEELAWAVQAADRLEMGLPL